ncbi:TetR/AcrR family transcriptional regulator [Pantoea sp. Morm]|uniref:TetR/AcrR family transcriptional regulator n=1 Tax=Pantoea sp. Morm TaxID=2601250 RepID=UPI0031FBAFF6
MVGFSSVPLNRRRMPRQERSLETVAAIFEATIQVLLNEGPIRLNTTRVAERAGVSVGTLYQYFPNKQSLLLALLERHLASLTSIVEKACYENLNVGSDDIASVVVGAYLEAIMAHAEVSPLFITLRWIWMPADYWIKPYTKAFRQLRSYCRQPVMAISVNLILSLRRWPPYFLGRSRHFA